jgi:phospholipid/cholesterol/gamma-HCH transport system substrate-binding protein
VNFRSNSVKVAITLLGAIAIAFVGYRFMKDIPILGPGKVISAVFAESKGLAPGRPVSYRGVQIGTIRTVSFTPSDSVRIEMNIDKDVMLLEGSIAYIRSTDLLGTMVIEILRGDSNTPLANNAVIRGQIEADNLGELTSKGKNIASQAELTLESLNNILGNVDTMLNAQMRQDLQSIARNLDRTTNTLNKILERDQQSISRIIANLEQITANIDSITAENRDGIARIVANVDSSSANFDNLTQELAKTSTELAILLEKMNKGEGSLGKMANDPSLYNNLDSLSNHLANLVKNLDENPRRYLRGLIKIF